jgi:hypothetical protein
MILAATESLPRCGARGIDMAAMATRGADDDENLVALRIHTDVHAGSVHRSNTFVHKALRSDDYWISK